MARASQELGAPYVNLLRRCSFKVAFQEFVLLQNCEKFV